MTDLTAEDRVQGLINTMLPYIDGAEEMMWSEYELSDFISMVRDRCVTAAAVSNPAAELEQWVAIAAIAHRRAVMLADDR